MDALSINFKSGDYHTFIEASNLMWFSFLFYFSFQENRENFPNDENIDLLSMPSTPQRKSDDAHVLHLEDKDQEARDSDSFTTQQLFSFAWQIARGMVMDI